MTRTLSLTIYGYSGSQEAEQVITIEYEARGSRTVTIEYLKILSEIEIIPSDLYSDIVDAIQKEEQAERVEIDWDEVEKNLNPVMI